MARHSSAASCESHQPSKHRVLNLLNGRTPTCPVLSLSGDVGIKRGNVCKSALKITY